jgi:oligopeptide/dipeptide ABC transporter ATP-binding protein
MYLGKLAEVSPVEELWAHPRHPYTDALLSAVPIPDPEYAGQRERIILVGDVPSPISPPSGCRFHPRCPKARQACVDEVPELEPRLGDEPGHVAACHFPVEDGEDISKSRPSIGADQRVIETGLVAGS